jgi:hypothetical protein
VPADTDADYVVRAKSNLIFSGMRILSGDAAQREALFAAYKLNAPGQPSTTKVVSIGDTPYRGSNLRGMDHWRELHAFMQREKFGPEDAMALAFLKRLGIEQGKPFAPDERQTRILLEAEKKGFAQSVALSAAREMDKDLKSATFYPGTYWSNPIQITDIGSKYLAAYRDASGQYLNSAFDYVLNVPANPPAEQFWSVTAYNAKTRAMVYTDRKDVSSRQDLFVAPDGATPVYPSSNCAAMPYLQNCADISGQGDVFVYFRTYAPTQAYFDKTWTLPDFQRLE